MGQNRKQLRNYLIYLYNGVDVRGPGTFSMGSSSIPHRVYHKLMVRKLLEEEQNSEFVTLDVEHAFMDGWRCDILLVKKHHTRVIEIQNPSGYVINVKFDTIEEGYKVAQELKKQKIISPSRYRNILMMLEEKTQHREETGRIHVVRDNGVNVKRISEIIAKANDPPELKRKCQAWDRRTGDLAFAISTNGFEEYIEDIWRMQLPVAVLYVIDPIVIRSVRRKLAEIDDVYSMNNIEVYEPEWESILTFTVDLEHNCLHSHGNRDADLSVIQRALERTTVELR